MPKSIQIKSVVDDFYILFWMIIASTLGSMDVNPFPYQRPVPPERVIDRADEVAHLLRECASGTLTRIDAPRRYGKTSLVGKLFHEAAKAGTVGVLVDLKGVLTLSDVTVRIGRAYANLEGPFRGALRRFLERYEADFDISVLSTGGGGGIRKRPENEEAALFTLLDLPVKFTADGWRDVIVCFDEFQDVLAVEAADDKIRSVIQHHPDGISYLFTGSEPRLMSRLFADKRRAFWSQAARLDLTPLVLSDCIDYIAARFTDSGRSPGDELIRLVRTGRGHPQRTMLLANKLWLRTPAGATASREDWDAALLDAKLQVEPEMDLEWRTATETEQRVLRAAATNEGRPFQKQAADSVDLARGSLTRTVATLVDSYVLRQVDAGVYAFIDPMFELYVRDLAQAALPAGADGERHAG